MVISVSVTPGTGGAARAEVTPRKKDTSAAPIKRISISEPLAGGRGVNLLHEPGRDGSSSLQELGSSCCTAQTRAQTRPWARKSALASPARGAIAHGVQTIPASH